MKIKCPQCRKEVEWEDNEFRPFCSERCKLIDLGAWLSGKYFIPVIDYDREKKEENEEQE
jgi:hypothetical protein